MDKLATFVLAGIALLGCGGGGDDNHWAKRKLETKAAEVGGIAFTIEVPTGMRMQVEPDEVEFDIHEHERVYTPSITIRVGGKVDTLDEYLAHEKEAPIRKEAFDGGFIVSAENAYYKGKEDYTVHVEKAVGDRSLHCNARVTPFKRGEKMRDKLPQVEAMCLSLTVQ